MIRESPEKDFTRRAASNPVHYYDLIMDWINPVRYYVLDVLDLLQDLNEEWAQDFVNVGKNSYMKMASKRCNAVIVPNETIVLPNANMQLKFTNEGIFIGKIGADNFFSLLKEQTMYEREIRARACENAGEEWPDGKPLIFYQKE